MKKCLIFTYGCKLQVLIGYVLDCLKGGNVIEEVGLNPNNAGEKGLRLLVVSRQFGILKIIERVHYFNINFCILQEIIIL